MKTPDTQTDVGRKTDSMPLSRADLHPTELALFAALPPACAGRVIITGNRTGALGLFLARRDPAVTVIQHACDLYHARALQRALALNPCDRISVACTSYLPEGPPATLGLLQATAHDTPAELVLDLAEDLHARLAVGAACLFAYDGRPEWLRKQVGALFGRVHICAADGSDVTLLQAVKQVAPVRRRDFSASFDASLPGDPPLRFTTLPGVFAHRRADAGGLALAEVAAREMEAGARILDLGCGCGLAGLLLAAHAPAADVLGVDAHTRAILCTTRNAAANGLANVRTALSDEGTAERGFTLCVANPPYYSSHRIAELFIRTAYAALAPGGKCYVVAKNPHWIEAFMREMFGAAEIIPRRGYGVVRAVRRQP